MARRRSRPIPNPVADFQTRIPPPVVQPQMQFVVSDADRMRQLVAERLRRQGEAINLFEPLPKMRPFHECRKRIRLALGGNRSSKTTTAAVEFARAVTGQDPHRKYPIADGVAFVFGLDGRHIGNTVYKKLFRAGAFKMIRDNVTGRWRAYRPVEDKGRAEEAKPAPPLIPRRLILSIAWEDKKSNIPKIVTLKNGWEIHFFSSLAELPQGQDIDLWWIDEEVKRENLIAELRARTLDRRGKGIWSATPQTGSAQLFELYEKAPDEDTEAFHAHILDNPFISDEEKDAFFRGLTDEERKVRWDGHFVLAGRNVFPEFSQAVHAYSKPPGGWQIPRDWAHYMAVDPGRQVCAVLFLAVPPPHFGSFVLAHDELYLEKCDAAMFGKHVGMKSGTQRVYEVALIDSHMGKVHDMGGGKNIEAQYRQALVANGVQMRNGVNFTWGCDDVPGGLSMVRSWLQIRASGQPYLLVDIEKCPRLCWEFARYRNKIDPQTRMPTDQPVKKNDHLMDCLRYLAMYGPKWIKPKPPHRNDDFAFRAFVEKKRLLREKSKHSGRDGITLG